MLLLLPSFFKVKKKKAWIAEKGSDLPSIIKETSVFFNTSLLVKKFEI